MSRRGGFTASTAPTGWVFIDQHRHYGYTIRWRRGDTVAYVLRGKRLGDHGMADALGTIPVLPQGWTDAAEIRAVGKRWAQEGRKTDAPYVLKS